MQTPEYFSVDDVRNSMQAFVTEHDGPTKAAKALGIDPALVSRFLANPNTLPTPSLVEALGYEARVVYVWRKAPA